MLECDESCGDDNGFIRYSTYDFLMLCYEDFHLLNSTNGPDSNIEYNDGQKDSFGSTK